MNKDPLLQNMFHLLRPSTSCLAFVLSTLLEEEQNCLFAFCPFSRCKQPPSCFYLQHFKLSPARLILSWFLLETNDSFLLHFPQKGAQ